ncbi:unnamed protein product [Cunninghamella echinulata]
MDDSSIPIKRFLYPYFSLNDDDSKKNNDETITTTKINHGSNKKQKLTSGLRSKKESKTTNATLKKGIETKSSNDNQVTLDSMLKSTITKGNDQRPAKLFGIFNNNTSTTPTPTFIPMPTISKIEKLQDSKKALTKIGMKKDSTATISASNKTALEKISNKEMVEKEMIDTLTTTTTKKNINKKSNSSNKKKRDIAVTTKEPQATPFTITKSLNKITVSEKKTPIIQKASVWTSASRSTPRDYPLAPSTDIHMEEQVSDDNDNDVNDKNSIYDIIYPIQKPMKKDNKAPWPDQSTFSGGHIKQYNDKEHNTIHHDYDYDHHPQHYPYDFNYTTNRHFDTFVKENGPTFFLSMKQQRLNKMNSSTPSFPIQDQLPLSFSLLSQWNPSSSSFITENEMSTNHDNNDDVNSHAAYLDKNEIEHQMDTLYNTTIDSGWRYDVCEELLNHSIDLLTSNRNVPWCEKYKPNRVSYLLDNQTHHFYIRDWLERQKVESKHDTYSTTAINTTRKKKPTRKEMESHYLKHAHDDEDYEHAMYLHDVIDDDDDDDFAPTSSRKGRSTNKDNSRKSSSTIKTIKDKKKKKKKKDINMIVLIGGHGVGKTTSVYTAAKETGYQVFELHPGIKRSYKNIIRLVGDMSQNHLVRFQHDKMNNKTHSKISSDSSLDDDDDDDEDIDMDDQPSLQPPPPQKNLLTHFFASNKQPTTKNNPSPIPISENVQDVDVDIDMDNGRDGSAIDITTITTTAAIEEKKTPSVLTQFFTSSSTLTKNDQQQQDDIIEVDDDINDLMNLKRLPHGPQQSLILLEEVDILSHDDKGFWNVVMELSKTSKRPIILTCNDPTVIPFESLELQAIVYYEPPLKELLLPFLHLICFIEGFFISKLDLQAFIHLIGPDLRQLLINLEYLCHHPHYKIKYLPETKTITDNEQQIIKEESRLLFKKHVDLLMSMVENTSIPPWLHISDNIPDLQVTPLCMQLIYRDYYKNNINNTINNYIHENETHSNNESIATKATTTPNAEMIDASSSSDLLFSIQSWLNNRSITDFGISMTETRMAEMNGIDKYDGIDNQLNDYLHIWKKQSTLDHWHLEADLEISILEMNQPQTNSSLLDIVAWELLCDEREKQRKNDQSSIQSILNCRSQLVVGSLTTMDAYYAQHITETRKARRKNRKHRRRL